MSTGLTIHTKGQELIKTVYCQEIGMAFLLETFTIIQAEGGSDFADYMSDGEGDWGAEIAKLPDPSNPKPEEIAAIEAKLEKDFPPDEVLAEAKKALAAIEEMDEGELEVDKEALISDFVEDFIPAMEEAVAKGLRVSLSVS